MAELNTKPKVKMSKLRIIKNLAVISVAFLLLFSGFNGLTALQSTMNGESGVGAIGQAIIYFLFCVSALLFPKYVIQKIGCRYSLIFSQLCYAPYILSNFYPHFGTVIPSSILLGLVTSAMWGGQSTYFNKASVLYSALVDEQKEEKKISTVESNNLENRLHSKEVMGSRRIFDEISFVNGTQNPNLNGVTNPSFDADGMVRNIECNVEDNTESNRNTGQINLKRQAQLNGLFFGCHSFLYQTSEIWSNLITYYVLKMEHNDNGTDASCTCGANFCNDEPQCLTEHIGGVPNDRRYLLTGICVAPCILAVILMLLFLDQIEDKLEPVKFSFSMVSATLRQFKQKEQIMLIPLALMIGVLQGFYMGEITKAYIGCAWGTYHIGMVTIGYGLFGALFSSIAGYLVKYVGRVPIISFGILCMIGTCILLLLWTPNAEQSYVFYIISSLFGVLFGVLWSQVPAFYGVIFQEDEEAAFAGFYSLNSLGWALPFVTNTCLCTYVKIYFLLALAGLGLIGYLLTERSFYLKKKNRNK